MSDGPASTDLHDVDVAVTEGQKFLDRAYAQGVEPGHPFVAVTGLAFGMLRAIMECPNCPGTFRVPITEDGRIDRDPRSEWLRIGCPHCHMTWTRAPGPLLGQGAPPAGAA